MQTHNNSRLIAFNVDTSPGSPPLIHATPLLHAASVLPLLVRAATLICAAAIVRVAALIRAALVRATAVVCAATVIRAAVVVRATAVICAAAVVRAAAAIRAAATFMLSPLFMPPPSFVPPGARLVCAASLTTLVMSPPSSVLNTLALALPHATWASYPELCYLHILRIFEHAGHTGQISVHVSLIVTFTADKTHTLVLCLRQNVIKGLHIYMLLMSDY